MLIFLLAGAAAVSDAVGGADAPSRDEAVVVTGQRLPEGADELAGRPGGTDLVPAEDYRDKAAVSLREALAFSPGVYAQPRFGQEIRLSIRGSGISRGFHMRGLTLLQDGIPINLADDNGDFQELDPLVLDRLEVYRGANAFRFGGTTLGGAINAVTPTGRTSPGFAGRIDGGSFDSIRGLLSGGFSSDRFDGWMAVTGDRSDGDRDHAKRDSLRLHGNLGAQLAPAVQTRFYVSLNHINQELPGGLPFPQVVEDPKTGNPAGDQQRDIDSVRIQNRTTVSLQEVALEFGAFANVKSLFHPIFQVVDQESVDKGVFARIGWETGPLELLGGATARFGTVDAKRFVNVDGARGGPTFRADQDAETIDVYGEARLRIGEASLIGGAVYTHGLRKQEQSFPTAVTGRASFDELSPRLGILWDPSEQLQIFANFSRSHELPGFIELAQIAAFVPLKAQRAWTAEAGARGTAGPVRFDLAFFRAAVKNELLQYSVGLDIPASTFNADKTLHQGIEAGLDVSLSEWASLRQVYQLNDFRFRDDVQYGDNRLPVIPRHLYRAELRLGPARWHVSPSIEWVPQGGWADYANSFRAKGYAMLGLSGEIELSERIRMFVDARNLTAKKAIGDISAVVDYRTLLPFQRAIFYPIERRALFAGVAARW
jgi:iron complex outermembrane receptor protein